MGIKVHPTCQIPDLELIYDRVFGHDFIGTFVEVGAFDGMTYSNTWGLSKAGWKGIYIEAHPDFANQCENNHRLNKVIIEPCACSNFTGEIELIVYGEVSTTVLSKWNRDWGMNESTPKIKVPCFKLDEILSRNGISDFDLLVIDVEEAEIQVLEGFTIANHLPDMVIIELHEGQGTKAHEKGWQTPWVENYLKGYHKIYSDKINTIFVKN